MLDITWLINIGTAASLAHLAGSMFPYWSKLSTAGDKPLKAIGQLGVAFVNSIVHHAGHAWQLWCTIIPRWRTAWTLCVEQKHASSKPSTQWVADGTGRVFAASPWWAKDGMSGRQPHKLKGRISLMDTAMCSLDQFCQCYIDDVVLHGSPRSPLTSHEHVNQLHLSLSLSLSHPTRLERGDPVIIEGTPDTRHQSECGIILKRRTSGNTWTWSLSVWTRTISRASCCATRTNRPLSGALAVMVHSGVLAILVYICQTGH